MPADDPDKCTGVLARAVAAYIHQAFYRRDDPSPAEPARVALSRMTVGQYLNCAADLIASFVGSGQPGPQRGLQGEYYSGRGFGGGERVFERIDPQVAFDFGRKARSPAKMGSEEFSIRWQGGVIADETGDYELVLTTGNGAQLWVNDMDVPLIDAGVQSGDDRQHRQTIRLLGGRVYPLRLELMKSKNEKAGVSLQWQPPHRTAQVIPQRNLAPGSFPPVLVVSTPFPADDRSEGYDAAHRCRRPGTRRRRTRPSRLPTTWSKTWGLWPATKRNCPTAHALCRTSAAGLSSRPFGGP